MTGQELKEIEERANRAREAVMHIKFSNLIVVREAIEDTDALLAKVKRLQAERDAAVNTIHTIECVLAREGDSTFGRESYPAVIVGTIRHWISKWRGVQEGKSGDAK